MWRIWSGRRLAEIAHGHGEEQHQTVDDPLQVLVDVQHGHAVGQHAHDTGAHKHIDHLALAAVDADAAQNGGGNDVHLEAAAHGGLAGAKAGGHQHTGNGREHAAEHIGAGDGPLGVEAGETYTFDQVLAVSNDGLKVGNPTVEGATVEASVVENGKAKKVIVYKYKRKTGYHKKNGHRQQYTAVKIEKINA